jgi:hypothetical protein
MQIVTSWMQTGIEQGRREGIQEGIHLGKVSLVMRLLPRRLGELDAELEARIRNLLASQLDVLSEALLDFATVEDLIYWVLQYLVCQTYSITKKKETKYLKLIVGKA